MVALHHHRVTKINIVINIVIGMRNMVAVALPLLIIIVIRIKNVVVIETSTNLRLHHQVITKVLPNIEIVATRIARKGPTVQPRPVKIKKRIATITNRHRRHLVHVIKIVIITKVLHHHRRPSTNIPAQGRRRPLMIKPIVKMVNLLNQSPYRNLLNRICNKTVSMKTS